jgi:hypothetical protein
MSKQPKYTDEPMEIGERVADFLPPPSQLVIRKKAQPFAPHAATVAAIKAARSGDLVKTENPQNLLVSLNAGNKRRA